MRDNLRTVLDRYLGLYRQLYLEEFFIVYSLAFIGLVALSRVWFLPGAWLTGLFLLLLALILISLVAYARQLPRRSLLFIMPRTAGLVYLGALAGAVFFLPFIQYAASGSLPGIVFLAAQASLVTEVLAFTADRQRLLNALEGEPDPHTSPRDHVARALSLGAFTRERVERAVAERMKAETLRTELITNISHDIRTPLTSILNFAQLLDKEPLGSEGRDYLGVVHKSAQRMKVMVDDLFTATKTASGSLNVAIAPVDFSEVLMQTYAPLHGLYLEKGLELVYNRVDETVPVLADGAHLSRVLQNLLGNAAKYSVNDTRIYVKVRDGADPVTVSVINISRDRLDMTPNELMEQFVRGDQSRHTEGSGLGLYIATNLLRAMAGELSLSIEGDVFTAALTLPKGPDEILRPGSGLTVPGVKSRPIP